MFTDAGRYYILYPFILCTCLNKNLSNYERFAYIFYLLSTNSYLNNFIYNNLFPVFLLCSSNTTVSLVLKCHPEL